MSEIEDLYKILGVGRDASTDEIKRAFKDLSLIYHPDKPTGNAEKFKEINNAYGILKDEEKRKMYDLTGSTQEGGGGPPPGFGMGMGGFPFGGFGGGGAFHMNVDINDLFGSMFGGPRGQAGGARRQMKRPKGANKVHELGVSLYDFFHGKKIKMTINRQVFCEDCNGEGCLNWKTCAECKGSGSKETAIQMGPGMIAVNRGPCNSCSGQGRMRGKECSGCGAKGLVAKPKELEVVIVPGAQPGDILTFEGMCSDHPDFEKAGDLQIRLVEVDEELDVERRGQELHTKFEISLKESLLGCKRTVRSHPGGEIEVEIPSGTQSGETVRVAGKGMIAGADLIVLVHVKVSEEERKTLENSKAILQSLFGV